MADCTSRCDLIRAPDRASRRSRALLGCLLGCGLSVFACGDVDPAGSGQASRAQESVHGVQLHLHGSMSEGPASMQGHRDRAARLEGAVDVLWWTDHDWRIAAHTYVDGFDFEHGLRETKRVPRALRMEEYLGVAGAESSEETEPVEWGWLRQPHPGGVVTGEEAQVELSEREARSGVRSLHLGVEGTKADWRGISLVFQADRARHIASLASDVVLRLSVMPVALEGDARLVLSLGLSQHPPDYRGRLEYRISRRGIDAASRSVELETTSTPGQALATRRVAIELPHSPGLWNDLELELSKDAEGHDLGGVDNAMVEVGLTLEARRGGRAEVYVDRFEIVRRRVGPALFEAEKQLARQLTGEQIVQHVGQEISYGAHLNAYGSAVPLADPLVHPRGLHPADAVRWAHQYGGLVSLNHVFGVEVVARPHNFPAARRVYDTQVERIIAARAWGADLLEVGYRKRGLGLRAFIELWDRLTAAGVRIVGVGVSDSHDTEQGWLDGPNNFITWVYALSRSQPDLLDGLRRGRAFFGDPTRFRGELDLFVEAASASGEPSGGRRDRADSAAGAEVFGRMGDVVPVSDRARSVRLVVRGLQPGQWLRVVRDGSAGPRIDPSPVSEKGGAAWPAVFERQEVWPASRAGFLRFEVHDASGAIALTNPVYFVSPAPVVSSAGEEPRP